jgi:hypothetical protein
MASVSNETDLSTLTGENDRYRKLVETKFQSEFGNVTWEAAQLMTKDEFLYEYGGADAPAVRTLLRAWMHHYELEARFKRSPPSPQQQNCELRCYSRMTFLSSIFY